MAAKNLSHPKSYNFKGCSKSNHCQWSKKAIFVTFKWSRFWPSRFLLLVSRRPTGCHPLATAHCPLAPHRPIGFPDLATHWPMRPRQLCPRPIRAADRWPQTGSTNGRAWSLASSRNSWPGPVVGFRSPCQDPHLLPPLQGSTNRFQKGRDRVFFVPFLWIVKILCFGAIDCRKSVTRIRFDD